MGGGKHASLEVAAPMHVGSYDVLPHLQTAKHKTGRETEFHAAPAFTSLENDLRKFEATSKLLKLINGRQNKKQEVCIFAKTNI